MKKSREEVFNTHLAEAFRQDGLRAQAEVLMGSSMPDVVVNVEGITAIIEARFHKSKLEEDAKKRLDDGLCQVAMAVQYSADLAECAGSDITKEIMNTVFDKVSVFYESEDKNGHISESKVSYHRLLELLNSCAKAIQSGQRFQNHVIAISEQLENINENITASLAFTTSDEVEQLISKIVIPISSAMGFQIFKQNIKIKDSKISKAQKKELKDLFSIVDFILLNSMVFHEVIANSHNAISPLTRIKKGSARLFFSDEWKKIRKIDYRAAFEIAQEIIASIPNDAAFDAHLLLLASLAESVCAKGLIYKHDFMGRLYHQILLKGAGPSYATYYTGLNSAHLLSRTAIGLFSKEEVEGALGGEFRFADFACGSGTLLASTYSAIVDGIGRGIDLDQLHKTLMEKGIFGADVLGYAAHLTLTTLALHRPSSIFNHCRIFQVAIGKTPSGIVRLGSLDALRATPMLFSLDRRKSMEGEEEEGDPFSDPRTMDFNLVIMNPPFSRSSAPKTMFGYVDPFEAKEMRDELAKLKKASGLKHINTNAGLGAFFLPLALDAIRQGGRIAFVLPRAFLSGDSWSFVRKMIEDQCDIEVIFSNFDPNGDGLSLWGWSFSESTDLGEIMFIARKRKRGVPPRPWAAFVQIEKFPTNEFHSYFLANEIVDKVMQWSLKAPKLGESHPVLQSGTHIASIFAGQIGRKVIGSNWLQSCVFASSELNYFVSILLASKKLVPLEDYVGKGDIFDSRTGYDISPLKQAFTKSAKKTPFRILWTHGEGQNTMELHENHVEYGTPKSQENGYRIFKERSAKLLIADRPHLASSPTFSLLSSKNVMATPFWEITLSDDFDADKRDLLEKAICLWLNSSYGIICHLMQCTNSQGEIFKLKKANLRYVLIPKFTEKDLKAIGILYEKIKNQPLNNLQTDWTLAAKGTGLRILIDDVFSKILQLDISKYYTTLADEPCATRKARR